MEVLVYDKSSADFSGCLTVNVPYMFACLKNVNATVTIITTNLHTEHCVSFSLWGIVYTHWPDTREFIPQTIELWNIWIRMSCNTCPWYTHV